MIKDYLTLAFRSLTHRKLRSWLTMIGIFIGIAAVVSLISLGQAMSLAIEKQFMALGANTITVQPRGGGFGPPGTLAATNLTERDLEEVQRVNNVDSAFGRLIKSVEVNFNDEKEFLFLASLPEETSDREYLYDARDIQIQLGRDLDSSDGKKVLVGNNYYRNEEFGRPIRPGDKIEINGERVEVVGVLARTGSPEIDISFLMNEEPMRDLLNNEGEYSVILARSSSNADVDQVAENIERDLRNLRNEDEGEESFNVETSQELMETFSTVLNVVQIVLIGIAAISLFVGGVGITNTMFTSVLERTREIGIMKAVGARNSDVLWLFLLESGLLGLAGGIIGVAIGAGLSKLVIWAAVKYGGLVFLEAYFPLWLILGSLAFSFVVGTISGIVPARRASRMDPVEALRE